MSNFDESLKQTINAQEEIDRVKFLELKWYWHLLIAVLTGGFCALAFLTPIIDNLKTVSQTTGYSNFPEYLTQVSNLLFLMVYVASKYVVAPLCGLISFFSFIFAALALMKDDGKL